MLQRDYYVPKSSGTLADTLLTYGAAIVLRSMLQNVPGRNPNSYCPVRIQDQGAYYLIQLPEVIQAEWLETSRISRDLAWGVVRKPEKQTLPEGLFINYNEVWENIRKENALVQELLNQQGRSRQETKKLREEIQELRDGFRSKESHRDVALLIGDYRMQVEGIHNQAVKQWHDTLKAGYQAANMRAILQLFASRNADVGAIAKTWASEVKMDGVKLRLTASQVFNPSMGKGQNRAKADQLTMGNEEYFWLVEYLKAVGLFAVAAPCAFSDENMRKTYVLAPANIEIGEDDQIFKRFKRSFSGLGVSPIKADILASLDYASAHLSYYVEAKDRTLNPNPRHSIYGFYVASYVLLSQNSFTMINLSFLGLPPWLNHIDANDVVTIQQVIEEQKALIRPLEEKFQEGNFLLDAYRDFLTGHRLDAFFDFCAGYGEYLLRTLPDNRFARQYSVATLGEIFRRMSMSEQDTTEDNALIEFMSTLKQHPGFHNIAYAIRHSTVIPQRQMAYYKSGDRPEKPLYDVRYGLGSILRGKSSTAVEFMEALTEFLQKYNAETDQVFENTSDERKKDKENFAKDHYRQRIAISDLDDILALIKKYKNPRFICNMLLAYGYAAGGHGEKEDGK